MILQKNTSQKEKNLFFTYPDTDGTMSFPGTTEPMVLTSTYFVAGIKDNTMIVETPRQFNRSTVVLWMKVK